MKTIYLVCNAHLDPVWLWEWEEGAAEAVTTFSTAADFCEEYGSFVFNHNEAILYMWVEEFAPSLFKRIQKLVSDGRWHIMSGWFLQPDCNMVSEEALVRQIKKGRDYFREKFGAEPSTAVNFDPFGHSRGMVQLLVQAGYHSYLFCRPFQKDCPLPADDFLWKGYDGSGVLAHRGFDLYHTLEGNARGKIERWIDEHPDDEVGLILWGIGNHGGGPSRIDYEKIEALRGELAGEYQFVHARPEKYFEDAGKRKQWPEVKKNLSPFGVGCYTSQIRIKQRYRELENLYFSVEKMASQNAMLGYSQYDHESLENGVYDLLFAQFHDILPGSSIPPVEDWSLQLMAHGLEILRRMRFSLFMDRLEDQEKPPEGAIPVYCYNPHPYPVEGTWECEFNLANQNWTELFTDITMERGGGSQGARSSSSQPGSSVPCQVEKERSNINLDWRKRIAFRARLAPASFETFYCYPRCREKQELDPQAYQQDGEITLHSDALTVKISSATGLIDALLIDGQNMCAPGAGALRVRGDDGDPWGSLVHSFPEPLGEFRLMSSEEASRFAGSSPDTTIEPVRVIEDGPVRTVVEALFVYGNSSICQHYAVPREGAELRIDTRVYWNERDAMLKLEFPLAAGRKWDLVAGKLAGRESLSADGTEHVFQQWALGCADDSEYALGCVNQGIYGLDCIDNKIGFSLLRSPAYAALPLEVRPFTLEPRFIPRIDQGERHFTFFITVDRKQELLSRIDRYAQVKNQEVFLLSAFPPSGVDKERGGAATSPVDAETTGQALHSSTAMEVQPVQVICTAFKQASTQDGYLVRLQETTGYATDARLTIPGLGIDYSLKVNGFELKTLHIDATTGNVSPASLLT
jgi:alpha-mannosidase